MGGGATFFDRVFEPPPRAAGANPATPLPTSSASYVVVDRRRDVPGRDGLWDFFIKGGWVQLRSQENLATAL